MWHWQPKDYCVMTSMSTRCATYTSTANIVEIWFVGCLHVPATCQCISGTDLLNFTCCHTEIQVADPTFYLTQSQYTDTWPTSPSADPIMPDAWQGSHQSANFWVTLWLDLEKSRRKRDSNPRSSAPEVDALTTKPTRRSNIVENCCAALYSDFLHI